MQCTVLSYLLLTLAALCTVSFAHATPDAMVIVPSTIKATEHWHGLLRRELHRMVERRQSAGARNETAIEQLDLQAWAKETTQKCIEQLKNVTKASNPSGIAVCYNLPFLSTDSGVFAADLRLYQVSAPQGDWASIGGNIDVSLMYNGAAVQLRNESAEEAAATQQASASTDGPKKVQEFHFIGQIDRLLLQTDKTDEQLKTLLTPNITLIATNSTGQQLMTVLSTNEATFVNGVFSDLVASEAQNSTAAAAASASATPFKLPGTRIEIVPIGLYFYSTYLGLALLIFGYGTFERQRFREQYRKRMAQQGAFGGSRAI